MIYDFIVSRGSVDVQNNLMFLRKNVELKNNFEKFNHLQNCLSIFLSSTTEDIPDVVRQLMTKIINYSGPVGSDADYKVISEMICSLRFYNFDVFLIGRNDLVEELPMDDGLAVAYLLEADSDIAHICDGNGREFEEKEQVLVNIVDCIMTWFVSGEMSLNTDIEQLCYIEAKKNDYSNLKARGMSIDFNANDVYQFLREMNRKPLLITNILASEFEGVEIPVADVGGNLNGEGNIGNDVSGVGSANNINTNSDINNKNNGEDLIPL